jgi:hypothetical protein
MIVAWAERPVRSHRVKALVKTVRKNSEHTSRRDETDTLSRCDHTETERGSHCVSIDLFNTSYSRSVSHRQRFSVGPAITGLTSTAQEWVLSRGAVPIS